MKTCSARNVIASPSSSVILREWSDQRIWLRVNSVKQSRWTGVKKNGALLYIPTEVAAALRALQ
ncbi:MAG: hypothetical protein D4R82_03555 [Dehalococcoidia bacterium]|nr:MAG: hypothetical protein D4R82_03555 [Dehalococcoidia bacterium]